MTTHDYSGTSSTARHIAIVSATSITIWSPTGSITTIPRDHPAFSEIERLVKSESYEEALAKANPTKALVNKLSLTWEGLQVEMDPATNLIRVHDEPLAGNVAQKAFELAERGWELKPLARFLAFMSQNPSFQSQLQALFFLERTGFAMTLSGHVLGYRGLAHDYKDKFSRSIDNKPGRSWIIEMPRHLVDDDRDVACSAGLHIGSYSYATSWASGGPVIACLINPKDIVSVPKDHNDEKMRVCRLLPLAEVTHELDPAHVWDLRSIPGSKYQYRTAFWDTTHALDIMRSSDYLRVVL